MPPTVAPTPAPTSVATGFPLPAIAPTAPPSSPPPSKPASVLFMPLHPPRDRTSRPDSQYLFLIVPLRKRMSLWIGAALCPETTFPSRATEQVFPNSHALYNATIELIRF